MTSSNGNIFSVTGHLCGEFTGSQRPVMRSFDVFFDLRLNKRLSKQSWGRWFETLSCPLWRHCNDFCNGLPWKMFIIRRLVPNRRQFTTDDLVPWRIYASPRLSIINFSANEAVCLVQSSVDHDDSTILHTERLQWTQNLSMFFFTEMGFISERNCVSSWVLSLRRMLSGFSLLVWTLDAMYLAWAFEKHLSGESHYFVVQKPHSEVTIVSFHLT